MKKKYSPCKLCLEEKELKSSHIYPKWAVKNCRDENTKRFVTVPKSNLQDGPKEHLLCEECEGKFGQREKYFRELILNRRTDGNVPVDFIRTEEGKIQITPFNFQHVKYFIMSILWRTSVTTLEDWKTSLKKEEQEALRLVLHTESEFTPSFFPTKTDLIFIDGENDSKFFINPHQLDIELGRVIAITICGIVFYIHPAKSNVLFAHFPSLKKDSWKFNPRTPAELKWLRLDNLPFD